MGLTVHPLRNWGVLCFLCACLTSATVHADGMAGFSLRRVIHTGEVLDRVYTSQGLGEPNGPYAIGFGVHELFPTGFRLGFGGSVILTPTTQAGPATASFNGGYLGWVIGYDLMVISLEALLGVGAVKVNTTSLAGADAELTTVFWIAEPALKVSLPLERGFNLSLFASVPGTRITWQAESGESLGVPKAKLLGPTFGLSFDWRWAAAFRR